MKIVGFDIETDEQGIRVRDSDGSEVKSADIAELLDFLVRPYSEVLMVVWDLDAFVAPLLKLMGEEFCRKLLEPAHKIVFGVDGTPVTYSIYYLQDKKMAITKNPGDKAPRLFATLYGFHGFCDEGEPELTTATDVAKRGNDFLQEMGKLSVFPKKLTSPVGALLSARVLPAISTLDNTPEQYDQILLYAERCSGRAWRENFKAGHWADDENFSYDLNSAYPYVASMLPDLRYATYIYARKVIYPMYNGFMHGSLTIDPGVKVSPIVTRVGDGRLITPVGTFDVFLTLNELKFIERWNLGKFRIKDGWFMSLESFERPLYNLLHTLYAQRSGSDQILKPTLKRFATGICGKFHEHHESGLGDYFSPIWFAIITSQARLMVAEAIYQNQAMENLIRVNIDSITADKPLELQIGTAMGEWKLLPAQPMIALSPEIAFTANKTQKGMDYAKLRTLICKHPRSTLYEDRTIQKRITLFEAMRDHELAKLGEMTTRTARVDLRIIQQSQIRNFSRFPRTGEQLIENKYTSTPIRLGKNSRNDIY